MKYLHAAYVEVLDHLHAYHDQLHEMGPMHTYMQVYLIVEKLKEDWNTYDYKKRKKQLQWFHSQILHHQQQANFMYHMSQFNWNKV